MTTSFATYASQFLNRQQKHGSGSISSSHPIFFSFLTEEESRGDHDLTADMEDLDDPHLRTSEATRGSHGIREDLEEDEDPYLRLDEDELRPGFNATRGKSQSAPLLPPENGTPSPDYSPRGWLAHLASPLMRVSRSRSSSPVPSCSSQDSLPPPELYGRENIQMAPSRPLPPHLTNREPVSLSLTESLLPRDGLVRPLDFFSLPDPRQKSRLKYHDSIWTVIWCTGISLSIFCSILLLFVTRKPTKLPPIALPYTTLLHTVPMLTILTFSSAFVAYTHVLLLRVFVKPVMIATSIFIPATLFISAIWAFVGSFMWDGDTEPTWGESVGLRLFSLVPLALSLITARRLLNLPRHIHTTSLTLNLTIKLLISSPFLLALSPGILLLTLLMSIPFLTLIFRLLLIGSPIKESTAWEWHIYGWANWSITGAVAIWLWSWGVARGILRMTCSCVVGSWYFADPDSPPPPPGSTHTIHAALVRSTGTSLGTVVLSALILTAIRLLSLLTIFLQRLPAYIPIQAYFLVSGARLAIGYLDSITTSLSNYALVYSGLTGDPFMNSARRAKALTSSVEAKAARRGRRSISAEPSLNLLTVAPLTLTFPFSLTTYLFVAHTLDAPRQALGVSMLAGGVTALVGLFCVGLIRDTADTLYICYCIDKDIGERRREEVFDIFEYRSQSQIRAVQQQADAGSSHLHSVFPTLPVRASVSHQLSQQRTNHPEIRPATSKKREFMPSESTTQYFPRQPLEPQSPLLSHLEEEVDDDNIDGDPFLIEESGREAQVRQQRSLRSVAKSQSLQQQQTLTDTELNMKSWARGVPTPYVVSSDGDDLESQRIGAMGSSLDSNVASINRPEVEEVMAGSSQLFPGSGLF